jgi:predicted RNase H-like nuclease (RuvC/YqgF family)
MASNGADSGTKLPGEWEDLELAVRRLLDEHDGLRARTARAEARCAELETTLQDYASGSVDPVDVQRRAEALERENRELRTRLTQARERVGLVMDRLRFAGQAR